MGVRLWYVDFTVMMGLGRWEEGFITVGLYSGVFPGSVVTGIISSFPKAPCKVTVDRITFASYRAQEMFGALTYRYEVVLH
jgi:hypothetical protein